MDGLAGLRSRRNASWVEAQSTEASLSQAIDECILSVRSGVLAIGSANAAFYRAMGVPEDRIFCMPYTVDNARYADHSRMTNAQRTKIRAKLGVADTDPIVLYAAKLQARKHPDDLLRAAARLKDRGIRFHVVMVGSGEMTAELVELTSRLGLENVHFHGFVNQSVLPQIYGAADVFVLPSENEPWGLAVNEAMCAGLPIVASAEVGCVADLVRAGVNGQTFAAGDVEGLANAYIQFSSTGRSGSA